MRPIRPIKELGSRLPEQGRIRTGIKGPKGAPKAIDTFRFTSGDVEAIKAIADIYGGTPKPWPEPKHPGEWEVLTEAKEISVVLPPDPLGDSPVYEMWAGGGIVRRCDGEVALVPQKTADGAEMTEVPCVCTANGEMACKPKTRLNVVLPDIRFGGVWRLETGGWNAAQELPGMVATIERLQERGFVVAKLGLRKMRSTFAGQTRQFVTPYLFVDATPQALAAGEVSMQGLATQSAPVAGELESAKPLPDWSGGDEQAPVAPDDFDDDIVDAELVGNDEPFDTAHERDTQPRLNKMFALLKECDIAPEDRAGFALRVSNGTDTHTSSLTAKELDHILDVLTKIKDGQLVYRGTNEQGFALVGRP